MLVFFLNSKQTLTFQGPFCVYNVPKKGEYMKKIIMVFAGIVSALVILLISLFSFRNEPMAYEKVRLEVNGELVQPLSGTHCFRGLISSYCVDMIAVEEYDFKNATIQLEGDTLVKVKAPWYFKEDTILIKDMNGGIFEFVLTTKNNTIPFVIYVE